MIKMTIPRIDIIVQDVNEDILSLENQSELQSAMTRMEEVASETWRIINDVSQDIMSLEVNDAIQADSSDQNEDNSENICIDPTGAEDPFEDEELKQ